jgi:hypothetical protein
LEAEEETNGDGLRKKAAFGTGRREEIITK